MGSECQTHVEANHAALGSNATAWKLHPPVREGVFVDRIEAVRGVAAMVVAITHALFTFRYSEADKVPLSLVSMIFSGDAAVVMFFTLSGLVLGMSLRRSKEVFAVEFDRFFIRRVLRIYPMFLVSTAVIVLCLAFGQAKWDTAVVGNWFAGAYEHYWRALQIKEVGLNLILNCFTLNNVTWTLRAEMICSLLLPLFHRAVLRSSDRQCLLLFGGWVVLGFFSRFDVLEFMFLFAAGYFIPIYGPRAMERLWRRGWSPAWVVAGAMVFLLLPHFLDGSNLIVHVRRFVECCASVVLIACLLYGKELRVYRLLDIPIVRLYGRISFSFYLWQAPCLFLVTSWLFNGILRNGVPYSPFLWAAILWFVSTLIATALSYCTYRWIEKPFIDKSRQICALIRVEQG